MLSDSLHEEEVHFIKFLSLQGNSNSLSTVDIAAGYIGLDDYWPLVNGLLLFMATYVGTIFWSLAFLIFLFKTQEQHAEGGQLLRYVTCCLVIYFYGLTFHQYLILVFIVSHVNFLCIRIFFLFHFLNFKSCHQIGLKESTTLGIHSYVVLNKSVTSILKKKLMKWDLNTI